MYIPNCINYSEFFRKALHSLGLYKDNRREENLHLSKIIGTSLKSLKIWTVSNNFACFLLLCHL